MAYRFLSPLLAILFAALMLVPAAAQDDPTSTPELESLPPLLMALSAVPDTPAVRTSPIIATFTDHRASYGLRGFEPASAYADMGEDAFNAAVITLPTTGVVALMSYFGSMNEMPAVAGFDFFEIDYALEFGQLPQMLESGQLPQMNVVIGGTFDVDAITEAHAERGYTAEPVGDTDGVLLCSADGCEAGMPADPDNIVSAYLPRRSGPLIASGSLILKSEDFDQLTAIQSAQAGDIPSLADDELFQAVANLLYTRPTVSAVVLVDPSPLMLSPARNQVQAERFTAQVQTMPPLPPYGIVAIAQTADDTYEYGELLLIYATAEDTEIAVASLTERLSPDGVVSLISGQSDYQTMSRFGELVIDSISDEETGLHAARIIIQSPLENEETARYARGFSRLLTYIMRRETLFLLPIE